MGISHWFRRLFGSAPGQPCALCRCNVPPSDIEKGIAVVVARKQYCKGCVEEITRRAAGRAGFTLNDMGSSSSVLLG